MKNSLPIRISLFALVSAAVFQVVAAGPRRGPMPSREDAIGPLSHLTAQQRAAFAADATFFSPIRKPQPNDWLANHQEPGQTVREYEAVLPRLKPKEKKDAIHSIILCTCRE